MGLPAGVVAAPPADPTAAEALAASGIRSCSPAPEKSDSWMAAPPARTTASSGRRRAAAATSAPSIGRWRFSSPPGVESAPSRTACVSQASTSRLSSSGSFTSALPPATSQPARAATSSSRRRWRLEPASTAMRRGGELLLSRRARSATRAAVLGRSWALTNSRSSRSARSTRSRMPTSNASRSVVDGAEAWASRRQRPPAWPTRAAEVVAAPRSRAKNARG